MSLTVSLIAVLIPLLFMGDIVGRLFREFAVTLSVTILVSAVVSLTLTPMMCARLLKHKPESRAGAVLPRVGARASRAIIAFYGTHAARGPAAPDGDAAGGGRHAGGDGVFCSCIIPKGFFPVQDTGVILGISEAPQTISFPAMARAAAGAGQGDPEGSGGGESVVVHRRRRHQYDAQQRAHSDQSEAARGARRSAPATSSAGCSRSWRRCDGITLYMQPVQDLTVEDRVSRTQYQYSLEDPDAKELAVWVPQFVAKLQTLPMLRDVASDQQNGGLAGAAGDRPRHRLAVRHHAADDRRHAVRRVRAAAGLDHVHAVEPVPRGAGGEAGFCSRIRTELKNIYIRTSQSSGARAQPRSPLERARHAHVMRQVP